MRYYCRICGSGFITVKPSIADHWYCPACDPNHPSKPPARKKPKSRKPKKAK